ncbi:MAG TPA: glycosyltransferase family 4 protein [Vicinamibacterales bacterium]|nr:glycosyltransferase family 4 protein [Vicinamibacterales bacterium]
MRILSITAGAGGMYCGSCFRDNALAAELIARGHDVTLMPVYTPTRTDEENVSRPDVLFGGISVYLQQHSALFRRTPRFVDRLWDSPGVIKAFAGRGVSTDARLLGDLTISMLEGERGLLKKEFDKLLEWTRDEPRPDVINLPNSLLISMAAPLKRALGAPVCCTLQGEELFVERLQPAYRDETLSLIRRQVPHVDRFVAVSEYCATFMAGFLGIPPAQMSVVPLGISLTGYTRRDPGGSRDEYRVGYFARIAPEKGLSVLADAYVRFRRRVGTARVKLEVAGYMSPNDAAYLEESRAVLAKAGLADEFAYHGELDRDAKLAFLQGLDVLSVPATYDEPKGVFLLEAMASGVPVVQPRRGTFTEVVEKTGGGLLVAPDDPEALAEGLHAVWKDRNLAARLAQCAAEGIRAHYTIARSADRILEVYESLGRRAATGASC